MKAHAGILLALAVMLLMPLSAHATHPQAQTVGGFDYAEVPRATSYQNFLVKWTAAPSTNPHGKPLLGYIYMFCTAQPVYTVNSNNCARGMTNNTTYQITYYYANPNPITYVKVVAQYHDNTTTTPSLTCCATADRSYATTDKAVNTSPAPLAAKPTDITITQEPTTSDNTATCYINIPAAQYSQQYGNHVYINGTLDMGVTNSNYGQNGDNSDPNRRHLYTCTGGTAFYAQVANLNSDNVAGEKSDPVPFTPASYTAPSEPPTASAGLTRENVVQVSALATTGFVSYIIIRQFRWRT